MRFLSYLAFAILPMTSVRAADSVDYVRDVLPIFETYCIGCHADSDAEGNLAMDSHAALINGGEHGLAITAGAPTSSRLFLMMTGKMDPAMPPEGEQRPSEDELAVIASWIEQGAIGPDGDIPIKRKLRTPKIETGPNVALPITAIAGSPDGTLRAVARFGQIEMQDTDGKVLRVIRGDFGKVNSVRFDRAGSRLLIASGVAGSYGEAALFSVDSGDLLSTMIGHRDVLYAAEFSPDETQIVTAGYDRDILLWNIESGEAVRQFTGHNGAVFDLAFSPDGKILVSGCADETVKVWNVETGQRLDTLNQPEGEVFAVDVTADGKFILAVSSDNRLRVWSLRSVDKPRINPIVATRFVDESPLEMMAATPDGRAVVVISEAGNIKVIRTSDWNQAAILDPVRGSASDLSISDDGKTVWVSLMNGSMARRTLPKIGDAAAVATDPISPIYLDLGTAGNATETPETETLDAVTDVPRGVVATGKISPPGDSDYFRFDARQGEVWAIEVSPANSGTAASRIDPIAAVLDSDGQPVLRTRLQAVRDSYFTFRGKDSSQTSDFRLFNWEEMHLNEFLYAAGEVTRLAMYPRGPDSGFNVYPNEGQRWTYFGTSHTTHALGEPAFIVRPLASGEEPAANGLPVFDVYYENDDDPTRMSGSSSRILFTAPSDGAYTVRVGDTRGEGGDEYGYVMKLRAAAPSFTASVSAISKPLRRGTGREATLRVDRLDGFDGAVTFDVTGLPDDVVTNFPVTIQPGQRSAQAVVWVGESAKGWEGEMTPPLVARGTAAGRQIERQAGSLGKLQIQDRPSVIASIRPSDSKSSGSGAPGDRAAGTPTVDAAEQNWTLRVGRGETVSATVVLDRAEGFKNEVSFGKENAGRNAAHGVYVDNIGLNGLLALEGMTEREFFITADPVAELGPRTFFLTAAADGGVTTHPITVEVTE
ncbi:c-type cytochrome domain-containing protein [Rubripirellula lacrimiformis]|nr:c-type cytochrome domain-containing protein [Rubripirellula lacrimiformis]